MLFEFGSENDGEDSAGGIEEILSSGEIFEEEEEEE